MELLTSFNILLVLFIAGMPLVPYLVGYLPERLHVRKMAEAFHQKHPSSERESVYLRFRCMDWTSKQLELDSKIAEMRQLGWTFLGATSANPVRTLFSWWGGMNLHFIRPQSEWQQDSMTTLNSEHGRSLLS